MGSRGTASLFLTSALDGRERSASCPGCFTPGKKSPGIHWIKHCQQRKISYTCRKRNHSRSARRYKDWAIPAPLLPCMRMIKEFSFPQLLSFCHLCPCFVAVFNRWVTQQYTSCTCSLCVTNIVITSLLRMRDIYRNCPRSVTHATWGLSICLAGIMWLFVSFWDLSDNSTFPIKCIKNVS
jgi:hypothetical protein